VISRAVADKLRGNWAPNVVVENRTGAGGQIAVTALKDSPPDGNTAVIMPSSCMSIYPFTYPKLPYKSTDVLPVCTVSFFNHAFAVGPAVPETVKTLRDFIAWAKQNPSKANYGSPAAGSMAHMIPAYVSKLNNLNWQHIAYRGGAPALQDMLGGQLSAVSSTLGTFLQQMKAGKIRILAVSGKTRSPFAPNVPTYREQGFPITMREWFGLFLPGTASPQVQRRLAAYMQIALAHPDVINTATVQGMEVQHSSSEAVTTLLKEDVEEWRRLIKLIGFTAES
jgi:tripartite-type tricarboxylate transporter receptor subunit TctC